MSKRSPDLLIQDIIESAQKLDIFFKLNFIYHDHFQGKNCKESCCQDSY